MSTENTEKDFLMKKSSNLLVRLLKYVFIALAALVLLLATFVFILSRAFPEDENALETKESIVDFYNKNSNSFKGVNQKINSISAVERNITRISSQDDTSQTTDPDIVAIKQELKNLNVKSVFIKKNGDIDYGISTWGLSMSGRVYGLYYSKKPPKNYYKCQSKNQQIEAFGSLQLMKTPPTGCSYTVFAKLDEDWYFYDEYED
jgi:hypothetical protein